MRWEIRLCNIFAESGLYGNMIELKDIVKVPTLCVSVFKKSQVSPMLQIQKKEHNILFIARQLILEYKTSPYACVILLIRVTWRIILLHSGFKRLFQWHTVYKLFNGGTTVLWAVLASEITSDKGCSWFRLRKEVYRQLNLLWRRIKLWTVSVRIKS